MGRKNVSLKNIADELGLSVNTVSHALRDFDDISEATKVKVRQKAIQLGYMPNLVSQRIKNGEKAVVAILVESFDNLYFNCLCNKLVKEFADRNEFDCQIIFLGNSHIEVVKQCVLQRVDLLITHIEFSQEVLEFAKLHNIQIVKINNNVVYQHADVVSVDEKMGGRLAARYLWGIHSCTKYVYVGIDYHIAEVRLSNFKEELQILGVNADEVKHFKYGKDDIFTLYDYILNGYRSIFFYNDATAYKVLQELDQISIDIRKTFPDLHIIGFDGLCEDVSGMRQISTIKIDYKVFANAIYETVRFRLQNPNEPYRKMILPVSLHQRRKKE